jgi:hypothetical protein
MILPLIVTTVVGIVSSVVAWRASGPRSTPLDVTTPGRATVAAVAVLYLAGSLLILAAGEAGGAGALLVALGLSGFAIGAAATRWRLGSARAMPAGTEAGVGRLRPWLVVGLAAVGLAAVGVLIAQHGLPLIAHDPQLSRSGFSGPLFDLFRWLVPPAAIVALAVALATGTRRDRTIAAAAVIGVAGLEILLASRALPFELGIAALMVAWWSGARLPARAWAVLGGVALVLFVGVQLVRVGPEGGFTGPADAAAFAVRRTFDRVLLIHPRTLEVVASTIPEEEPYFGGSTYVRRLAVVLGQDERPTLGFWIYERLFPDQPGGFAAPGVLGEAWANAGPVLSLLVLGLLGAAAVWAGDRLAMLPPEPADRAFAALVVLAFARTYATSLNGFILTIAAALAWWLIVAGLPRRRAA